MVDVISSTSGYVTSPSPRGPSAAGFCLLLLVYSFPSSPAPLPHQHLFGAGPIIASKPKRNIAAEAPKRASKRSKAANSPTIAAKTPAESVYAVPEIRQRLLSFLDLPTLAAFIRVEKAASNDVARELYKEVDYKHMLNKMSRTNVSHPAHLKGQGPRQG